MQKLLKTKIIKEKALSEELFQEAKVRIVMKVRRVSREKALAVLAAVDSLSVATGSRPVNPAAMPGGDEDNFKSLTAKEFFGA